MQIREEGQGPPAHGRRRLRRVAGKSGRGKQQFGIWQVFIRRGPILTQNIEGALNDATSR